MQSISQVRQHPWPPRWSVQMWGVGPSQLIARTYMYMCRQYSTCIYYLPPPPPPPPPLPPAPLTPATRTPTSTRISLVRWWNWRPTTTRSSKSHRRRTTFRSAGSGASTARGLPTSASHAQMSVRRGFDVDVGEWLWLSVYRRLGLISAPF